MIILNARNPFHIIHADVLIGLAQIPDESIHCIITSPPYWTLRDYMVAGQIGLEDSLQEWLDILLKVFMECHRVLRMDGTFFLNIGDSYATNLKGSGGISEKQLSNVGSRFDQIKIDLKKNNLKPKDMVGQPWTLAFALRNAGWFLRSEIIWHKNNAMPEQIGSMRFEKQPDGEIIFKRGAWRPTKAHETIFLLTKSDCYFGDSEAIKEPNTSNMIRRAQLGYTRGGTIHSRDQSRNDKTSLAEKKEIISIGRNSRSVWLIPTSSLKIAHFASFPPAIPEKCIKAGTSEYGVCGACGAPFLRILEKTGGTLGQAWHDRKDRLEKGQHIAKEIHKKMKDGTYQCKTIGWKPYCKCNAGDPIPATVLDPFSGAGTTAMVALRLGRFGLGIEINEEYVEKSIHRITHDQEAMQLKLF